MRFSPPLRPPAPRATPRAPTVRRSPGTGAPCAGRGPAARAWTAGVIAAATLAACGGDPFAPDTSTNLDTQERVFQVYPLSTANPILRTAVNLATVSEIRPGVVVTLVGNTQVNVVNFDFAVDRAPDGRVRLLPSKFVAGLAGVGVATQTGFRVVSTPFDSLAEAPSGGYQTDSVATVNVGQTVAVEAQLACYGRTRPNLYAKFVVDSVSAATGAVFMRGRVDPNCGFRSLRPGRPTS